MHALVVGHLTELTHLFVNSVMYRVKHVKMRGKAEMLVDV